MQRKNVVIVLLLVIVLWIAAGIFGPEIQRVTRIRAEAIIKIGALLILGGFALYQYFLGTRTLHSDELQPVVELEDPVQTDPVQMESGEFVMHETPVHGSPIMGLMENSDLSAFVSIPNPEFPNTITPAVNVVGTDLFAPIVDETFLDEPSGLEPSFPSDVSSSLVIGAFVDDCVDDQTFEIPWNPIGLNFDSEIDLLDDEDMSSLAEYLDACVLAV